MQITLSKSDFLKYRVCPSYFWLWKHKPELVPDETTAEVRNNKFEQGNKVEAIARKLFPEGILVDGYNMAAQVNTERIVADGATTLFQATVVTDNKLLAMADILEQDGDSWILYEVKSSGEVKIDTHVPDMAFQKIVFEQAGYKISGTRIIHLNKQFTRHGNVIDPQAYFIIVNVDDAVNAITPDIKSQIQLAIEHMMQSEAPPSCPCRSLPRGKHCPTFAYFNPDIPAYSVYNISRLQGKKLADLVDNGTLVTTDIPDNFGLSTNQSVQVAVDKSGQALINHARINAELSQLRYPLYFIDYESVNSAIPLLDNTRPHQQVVFQYSLHILDAPDGGLRHTEYLCRNCDISSFRALVDHMSHNIGDTGSVIVWNKSFEQSRNKELGELFPEYKAFLYRINDRIYDLMDVFRKNYYVDPAFKGSNSIKDVLPVLAPHLSYKELAIGKGDLAAVRWYEIITGEDRAGADQVFTDLLEYCKLDTLAMVEIYRALRA